MNYLERIDDYLNGTLSLTEQKEFEDEIKSNIELQRELELTKMSNLVIDAALKEDLSATIKDIRGSSAEVKRTPIRKLWIPLSVAASIAILIGIVLPSWNSVDHYAFAQESYATYQPNFSGSRGPSVDQANVISLLSKGKALEAETILRTEKPVDTYLLGHSLMMQGKFKEALIEFQNNQQSTDSSQEIQMASEFYLALCLIGIGDSEKGQAELGRILNNKNHSYSNPAEKVTKRWSVEN